ncbi:DUF6323 family protein [Enterococcus sp. AZ196]|uniref:DUF6323 family protein n=1 Tax=Enterococcus sp. AZ196 TaxID=2774659 RepID=UPI003D28D9A7
MARFDLTLFNQFLTQQEASPRAVINQELQAKHKNFQLSVADFSEIAEERNQLFMEHHLLDFSWQNTHTIAYFLVSEPLFYKSDYLEHLSVCQAIFYYLRAHHSGQMTDQEILEEIQERYQEYQGDLEMLQGSFEDFPDWEEK